MDRVDDPVDPWVSSDSLVGRVNEDDLKILVCRILVDPVRVEDSQVGASSTDSFLGGRSEGSLVLQLVDTLVGGLACSHPKINYCSLPQSTSTKSPGEHTISGTFW